MRVSEHIEHHARKAKRHVQERPKLQLFITVLLTLIGLSLLFYGTERYSVAHQNLDAPLHCTKLSFPGNVERCEAIIFANYSARAVEERKEICDEPTLYGNMTELCIPYYELLSERLYGAALQENGVSIWEPTVHISKEYIHYRSLSAISQLHLVCNQALVNISFENEIIKIKEPVNGTCVLIATTAEGSVTSLPFNLSSTHISR
jgi:hypothetical protein